MDQSKPVKDKDKDKDAAASSKCERVFSVAGNIVTPKRASLNPEKVEQLIVIKCNMQLLRQSGGKIV